MIQHVLILNIQQQYWTITSLIAKLVNQADIGKEEINFFFIIKYSIYKLDKIHPLYALILFLFL